MLEFLVLSINALFPSYDKGREESVACYLGILLTNVMFSCLFIVTGLIRYRCSKVDLVLYAIFIFFMSWLLIWRTIVVNKEKYRHLLDYDVYKPNTRKYYIISGILIMFFFALVFLLASFLFADCRLNGGIERLEELKMQFIEMWSW